MKYTIEYEGQIYQIEERGMFFILKKDKEIICRISKKTKWKDFLKKLQDEIEKYKRRKNGKD